MNRPLSREDCRRRSPDPGRASRFAGAVSGVGGLVRGTAAYREGAATAHAFKVIKHGGFARFWRETPCAMAEPRKGPESLCF